MKMEKTITAECHNCESSYAVNYIDELTSQEYPEHCPFCGEVIDEIQEEYIEDDDDGETEEWDD
jgi:NAD-dependent SIR2 family protein deacetylase